MAWTPPTDAVAASAGDTAWTPPSDAVAAEPEAEGARGLSALYPSIMRGGRGIASLGGDVLPAMVGKAFGANEYAIKQMQEAKEYGEETEKLYPAAVGSYKNVKDLGTGFTYVVEAVGEAIPSLIPSLFTGGVAAIAGRGAIEAAKLAAEKAVMQAAKGATEAEIKAAAMKAGVAAANKVALKYQAAGAITGSAAQNVPDVFQNIYEKTGKMDLGAAIVAGGFNAALDAVLPVMLLRKAGMGNIPPEAIAAAWYKRMGKGAALGFATEGSTEAVQEMSSAAAEKFVDNNLNFFTKKNFERFIDAGLKGGIGGGAITGVTDVVTGKGPEKKKAPASTGFVPPTDVAPPPALTAKQQTRQDKVTQRAQQLEEQSGITAEDAVRIAEDDIAAEEAKLAELSAFNAPKVEQALSGADMERESAVKIRATELLATGMKPEDAYATALQQVQEEIENDVLAGEEGARNVTGPKPTTSGKRTRVARQPATGAPAAGPAAPTGVGVVPPTADVGVSDVGETAQPPTVVAPPAPQPGVAKTEAEIRAMSGDQLADLEIEHAMGLGSGDAEYGLIRAEIDRRKTAVPPTISPTPADTVFVPPADAVATEPATRPEITAQRATLEKLLPKEAGNLKLEKIEARSGNWRVVYTTTNAAGMTMQGSMPVEAEELMGKTDAEIKTILADRAQKNGLKGVSDTIKGGGDKPKPAKASKAAKEMPPQLVDLAVARAATDPAEIQKHLADIEAEYNSFLGTDGRRPKKGSSRFGRFDALNAAYRELKAKLKPAVAPAPTETTTTTTAPAPTEAKTELSEEEKYQAREAEIEAAIRAEDEADAALDARVAEAESIGRGNARTALDIVDSEYGGDIDAAIDSYRQNTQDTLAETRRERGERPEEQSMLSDRADQAFDAEVKKLKAEAPAPTETKTEAPAPTETEAKKPDSWVDYVDEIAREVDQELAGSTEYEGYVRDVSKSPFVQTRGPSQIAPLLNAELAEEKRKRRGVGETEAEVEAKAAEEEQAAKATPEETAEAAQAAPDEAAKKRAGAVDVMEMSPQIIAALQQIITPPKGLPNFPEGVKADARKILSDIIDAAKTQEAPEATLERAFTFLTRLANKPRFMRTGINKSLPSIGKAKVQAIIDLVVSRWKNAPTVVVAENIDDAVVPAELQRADREAVAAGAKGVPAGIFYQGKVYIFANQMKSAEETVRTLLHESLGHYGLRGVFGDDLKPILQLVSKNFKTEMDALVERYGLDFRKEADVMEAAEEVLANLAQTKPTMGVVQRVIAAVRRFLRKIGVDVKLSNNDLIANYILPARAFVEGRRIARIVGGKPGFSRKATDKFLAWFGNSKVVDKKGEPLVVYHGTNADITKFKASWLGSSTNAKSAEMGFFFAGNPSTSSAYLKNPDPLGIRNPLALEYALDTLFTKVSDGTYELDTELGTLRYEIISAGGQYYVLETHNGNRTVASAFVDTEADAVRAANEAFKRDWGDTMFSLKTGPNLMPVYLSIQNPFTYDMKGSKYRDRTYADIISQASDAGHDGVVIHNTFDGGPQDTIYVVFKPNQIKSAIGNNGDYSLTNDDIRFSRTTEEAENLTPEQSKIRENTVRTEKEIEAAVAKAKFKFEESAKAQKAAKGVSMLQMATDPRKIIPAMRDLWKRATSIQRNVLVKIPPTSFLTDWVGNAVPELQNTYKLLQRMGGMTEQLLNSAGELTTEVQRAFQADPTLRGKLDELASVATLAEVDPGMVDTAERSGVLDKAWKDLGPEGQRVYKRIRDHFNVLSKYLSKLLDDQVNSLGIDAEAKANIMKKIRATFEKGSRINPYFPLVREGNFWLAMNPSKSKKAADYVFFMGETAAERDRVAREFAAEQVKRKDGESEAAFNKRIDDKLGELYADSVFEYGDDVGSLRAKTYSQGGGKMLTGVFDAIDSANLTDPEAAGALKDAIYQTFLETMPDQVFRKQFIHRKGVAGFRVDVLQNTAHLSARMATQLARIKYSPLLRNSLSAAKDSIRGRPAFEPFVAEMASRVDAALAPKAKSVGAAVAGGLNKAAFIYYLSGASSALLQPLSLFQTGMPVLARYGAFKATREMGRMLKVWSQFGVYKTNADGSKSWVAPSILNAKDTTAIERKAYRAAAELGLFTSTQASSVFEYKATPTDELKGPKEKFVRGTVDALVLGGLMNSSERMSREAMFMTSFRLNMEQHGDFARAVSQATYDTNEALGAYGDIDRPAFMRNSIGKVLTQFMMYPLHVTMFLLKNFKEMIKPMNGRSRAEASYKFFGNLGTTYILAGATGLPMFSTVMGLLGAAWEELKDDDWDESMRALGFEAWLTTKFIPDQLGETKIGGAKLSDLLLRGPVNAFTGVDIASRTSENNLFFRDSKEQKTIRESAVAMALEKAGPAANMVLTMADGIDAAMQGDYAKAVKKWAPAGFRNFVTAHELATEGAKDNKGVQLIAADEFGTGVLIAKTIGFNPDRLANTQYVIFKVVGAQQKIFNEQNRLLERLDREFRNENADAYSKQIDRIVDFNRRYPSNAIDMDKIVNSLEARMENRGRAYMGVVPTEKNLFLMDALTHVGRRVAEAESKGKEP